MFPDAKWVVITRPVEEVRKSCETIQFPFSDFTDKLKKIIDTKEVLKVKFSEVFDKANLIGEFFYEDWECPQWRLDQFREANIQLNWDGASKRFRVPDNLKSVDVVTPTKLEYYRTISEIVNKDPYVIRFLEQARDVSCLYRSLDQGKPIDVSKTKDLLEAITVEWPINPFLQRFSSSISPALAASIEKYSNDPNIRCPVEDLATVITFLFRGREGVKEWMPKIRRLSARILKETK